MFQIWKNGTPTQTQISLLALGQLVNAKQLKKNLSSLFSSDIAQTDQVEAVPKMRCSRNVCYCWE